MDATTKRSGDVIDGRYTLGEILGVGGMGIVYAAVQTSLGRPVAIKLPRPELVSDEAICQRLRVEAMTSSRLSHQNIVRVFDYGDHDGQPFLVMEHVIGERLGEQLPTNGMPVAQAVEIVRQILAGLDECHREGIVHGDVKCDNVLVEARRDGSTIPRLIDFGLARFESDAPVTYEGEEHMVSGTPDYLAPELVRGEAPSVASDLYAAGIILYELVTGAPPFTGGSSSEILLRQLSDTAVPVSWKRTDVPAALDVIIARALEKSASDRYATAADFLDALDDATLSEPPRHTRTQPLVSARECTTAQIQAQSMTMRLASGSRPPGTPFTSRHRAIGDAIERGDADGAVVGYLEMARALIDANDRAHAIAELESGLSLIGGCAPAWRLQLTLAALYDGAGDRIRACQVTRLAYEHATHVDSALGRERAAGLLRRLVHG